MHKHTHDHFHVTKLQQAMHYTVFAYESQNLNEKNNGNSLHTNVLADT